MSGRSALYTPEEAAAVRAAQNRAWFQKRRAAGLCCRCGKRSERFFYCFDCRLHFSAVKRASREEPRS